MATRAERLVEFLRRLTIAPAARSFDEAYGQVFRIMNEVEDELSGVPYDISKSSVDGRLYPPLWDTILGHPFRPRVRNLRSRGHTTLLGDNGSIQIRDRTSRNIVLEKPGADGKKVDDL